MKPLISNKSILKTLVVSETGKKGKNPKSENVCPVTTSMVTLGIPPLWNPSTLSFRSLYNQEAVTLIHILIISPCKHDST